MIDELDGVDAARDVLRGEARGVVIDFWSPWCAPCRTLRPHLCALADEHRRSWRFVALNTEAHPAAAEEFGVESLPTIAWFRDGEEITRLASTVTLSAVASKLDELSRPPD